MQIALIGGHFILFIIFYTTAFWPGTYRIFFVLAYLSAGTLCFACAALNRVTPFFAFAIPLAVWDVALQELLPELTRMYTSSLLLASSSVVLLHQGIPRTRLTALPFSLAICVPVGAIYYLESNNTTQLVYIVNYAAASLMLCIALGKGTANAERLLIAFISFALSSGLYAVANILFSYENSLISEELLINPSLRLGNFNRVGANSVALVYGVGVISGFIAWRAVRIGALKFVLLVLTVCSLFALVLTKTLSALLPLGLIGVLIRARFIGTASLILRVMFLFFVSSYLMLNDTELAILDKAGSGYGRLEILKLSTSAILNNLSFGVPFSELGNYFPRVFYSYSGTTYADFYLTPHNLYIANAVYFGIPAAVLFLVALIYTISRGWIKYRRSEEGLPGVFFLSLFLFFYHLGVDVWNVLSFVALAPQLMSLRGYRAT